YSSLASYILEFMKNLPERTANTRFRSFADDLNKLKNYFEKDREKLISSSIAEDIDDDKGSVLSQTK
ncbi:unnamed protein product, partial [Brachionus calyciflorus]